MDEKQLRFLLLFGSDASKAQEDIKKLQSRAEELQKRMQTLRETMKLHKAVGKDADALEKELQDITHELVELDQKAQRAQTALRGMANSSRDIRDNLFNLRDIGEKLDRIGGTFERFGRGILSPITGSIQSYLQSASPFDTVAFAWKQAQMDIQQSFTRIGAVATNELLPALRMAADLVAKIADLVERNPDLIKAGLMIGGSLVAIGGLAQLAGQITMLIGVTKALNLPALLGGLGSAGGALLNPYVGATALVGAGAAAGYNALSRTEFGAQRNMQAAPGQLATIAAYYSGRFGLFGSEERGQQWAMTIGQLTGVVEKHAEAAQRDAMATQQQLDAFVAYEQVQQQRTEYERRAQAERNQIITEFAAQRVEIERSYENNRKSLIAQYAEQRLRLMRDFDRTERQAEQDYYQNRLKLSQTYQIDVRRAEEDHQRRMRQMRADHDERLQDLIENRDALGIIREKRSYERRRQEEEETYRIQAARRSEDFARQIQEMESQFAVQRQRRLEDYRLQLNDMAEQHRQRMAQLAVQRAEELKRLDEQQRKRLQQFDRQYQNELQQLRNAEQNRLNILRMLALNDQTLLQKTGAELTARYKAWLEQQVRGFLDTKPQRRASGGLVNAWQPYLVGEQGPELFVPEINGTIVPDSLTRAMLSDTQYSGGKVVNMRIETSSLTFNQVMREVERRLDQRDRLLARAIGG